MGRYFGCLIRSSSLPVLSMLQTSLSIVRNVTCGSGHGLTQRKIWIFLWLSMTVRELLNKLNLKLKKVASQQSLNWMFSTLGLDLSTFHSDFKDVSQWAIERTIAERQVLPDDDNNGPHFSVLTYTLELKRNLVFASYILTLPCVFLACLTLVVFWLPPDRPDRTALGNFISS